MAGSIAYPPLALQQVLQDDEHEYLPTSEPDGLVANHNFRSVMLFHSVCSGNKHATTLKPVQPLDSCADIRNPDACENAIDLFATLRRY